MSTTFLVIAVWMLIALVVGLRLGKRLKRGSEPPPAAQRPGMRNSA